MDTSEYLRNLGDDLSRSGIAASDLVALVFEANGLDIDVRTRPKAHPPSYPAIREMLGTIGASCLKEGIAIGQLRRITFGDSQVTVEFTGNDERSVTRSYSIQAVMKPATSCKSSEPVPGAGMASRATDGIVSREEVQVGDKLSLI